MRSVASGVCRSGGLARSSSSTDHYRSRRTGQAGLWSRLDESWGSRHSLLDAEPEIWRVVEVPLTYRRMIIGADSK